MTNDPSPHSISIATRIEMQRRMLRIRLFEEEARRLKDEGTVDGPVHCATGQEATVVGACLALRDSDTLTGTHRSHGHPIAKGAALDPLMAELLGRRDGICRGQGGSMHLADFGVGSLGEAGIVGAGIPVATGAGLSARVRGTDGVCLCFFGDGASNQGTFHESLNMASVWKLPVVYLCENNLYAATTPLEAATSVQDIALRAQGYGMPSEIVDGQDVRSVYAAVARAVERARAGGGPTLVEAKTYRYCEHADGEGIPGGYRDASEIERWLERDPLALHREQMLAEGEVERAQLEALEKEVRVEVDHAVRFAHASPAPEPGEHFPALSTAEGCLEIPRVDPDLMPEFEQENEGGRELSYLEAIYEAQAIELGRDERVVLIAEDIGMLERAGAFGPIGPNRLWSAPISENGFVGMAVGAALTGLRPIVDLMIASLVWVAMDQIVSQAAKIRTMFGDQTRVPMVLRAAMWYASSYAAHHSDRPYPLFMNVPGLKIAVPATPADAKGLLMTAIRDDDPVLLFEEKGLWSARGSVPEGEHLVPFGRAALRHRGDDVTLVAIAGAVPQAVAAAQTLAAEGIGCDVIDPRTLVPLDIESILASVARTGRLVIVDPASRTCSAAAEIAAQASEHAFDALRAPIQRITTPDLQIPFAPSLEMPLYPNPARVVQVVRRLLGQR
ncbi:MAG: dehydrogenase [Deltaproteobacteria bacterium]|nr:dehydrogenase [Deltaproteobacteria bacterium]